MKEIEKKVLPDVPGGISPGDYFPQSPIDVPGEPIGTYPRPLPGPDSPQPLVLEQ